MLSFWSQDTSMVENVPDLPSTDAYRVAEFADCDPVADISVAEVAGLPIKSGLLIVHQAAVSSTGAMVAAYANWSARSFHRCPA